MRFAILLSLCAGFVCAQANSQGSYLGVGMREVTDPARFLNLPIESAVEVTSIVPDSPAEKAGLQVGDLIFHFDGKPVEGNEQFSRLVRDTPPGREVRLDLIRWGQPQTVTVKVALRKLQPLQIGPGMGSIGFQMQTPDMARSLSAMRNIALGVEAEPVDGQLAQYFGVKEGVLVRSVVKGSSAEKAGIRAGDVIVKFDGAPVAVPQDISNRIRVLRGKTAQIALMRDRKEVTLGVTFEEMPGGVIQITPFQVHQPQP
jgi:serine protease Do